MLESLPRAARLRQLRSEMGYRQADLASLLGIARCTVSNLEAGRQGFTEDIDRRLALNLPGWNEAHRIATWDEPARVNPGLLIDDMSLVYIFEDSRSPSEIVQGWRVRATRAGVTRYCVPKQEAHHQQFETDTQTLYGGVLSDNSLHVNFGGELRRGETHDFALRSWVERAPDPRDEILIRVTQPLNTARLHLRCHGRRHIAQTRVRIDRRDGVSTRLVSLMNLERTSATAVFRDLRPGDRCELTWDWSVVS